MRTPLASLTAAAALVVAPLAAMATPAHAATCTAPEVVQTEVAPHNVVVGTTKVKGFDVYADVATNGCAIRSVEVTIASPKHTVKNLPMKVASTADGVTTYVYGIDLSASTLENAEAGTWTATSVTRWSGGTMSSKDTFRVFRASKLTTNAKPEPVRAGQQLVVTGKLTRAAGRPGSTPATPSARCSCSSGPATAPTPRSVRSPAPAGGPSRRRSPPRSTAATASSSPAAAPPAR